MGENWRIRAFKGDTLDCTLTRGPRPLFRTRLREMEVLRDKHIPALYLRAGNDQRLQLLQGLMDSDGHIAHAAGRRNSRRHRRYWHREPSSSLSPLGKRAPCSKETRPSMG